MKDLAVTHIRTSPVFFEERHFLEALTRWNYFPNQKELATELPPNLCTRRFTPEIAHKLLQNVQLSKTRKRLGFDLVEYRSTRYNNVSRILGLIHPMAYAKIFAVIEENVEKIKNSIKDPNSAITIECHIDGRMLIMNYEDPETKALTSAEQSFGKKFRAHTDVANCFGSIYTHSVEWAIQGFAEAKAKFAGPRQDTHWSSELDDALRSAKRAETSGLPIGPASSSIAVEIILAAVDCTLREKYSFVRYIDDYTALCNTHAQAEDFIRDLGKELSKYKLTLNLAKTSVVELPEPLQEHWVSALTAALPPLLRDDGQIAFLNTRDAFQFLDHAVRLNNSTPDGSVLKFAVSAIARRLKDKTAAEVFQYVLNLAWHYPILLPYLEQIDARANHYDKDNLTTKLNEIIRSNALQRRSDGMCWALYYLERLGPQPSANSIAEIIESKDCVALAMLSRFETATPTVINYAKTLLGEPCYTIDENWLLFYQLYFNDKIDNPYSDEDTFKILKHYGVDFFCNPDEQSTAEQYCSAITCPFIDAGTLPTFDEWMAKNA